MHKNKLDYLGFVFDGQTIRLREKACLSTIAELTEKQKLAEKFPM